MPSPARLLALVVAGLLLPGSGPALQSQSRPVPTDPRDPLLNQGPKAEATGNTAMVSTQLASSTVAALDVLRDGGNAVDAAITAAFLHQVDDYHMVFLFGSMSALYYEAATGRYYAISAVAARPDAERGEGGDAAKVAIGGTVRGLAALADRFGTRPWASYLQPAIRSAEEGVIVTSFMYGLNFALFEAGVLDGGVSESDEGRRFYMPDGHLVPVGHRWKMPALAETLRRVASAGPDYMYTGEWGQRFVREATKRGGRVTLDDMADYQPIWDEPTRFTYRGHEILGSPPPDTGGLIVGYNLNILEQFDLKKLGHYAESAETLEIMARAFDRAGSETRHAIRDPLNFRIPAGLWLSKEYGRMGAEFVRETMPRVNLAPARPAQTAGAAGGLVAQAVEGEHAGSDHLVIVDGKGNWLSMLHTIHGGAPGVFIDGVRATGTGAQAATIGPGRRIGLPITAIMIAKDGKPWLAMGTPGNPPQPVTQVLVNMLDFGMDPAAAADAPRFWAFRGNDRTLDIESRIAPAVREGLAARGLKIKDLGDYNFHTGSMQIVWRDAETGNLRGVSDARRLGHAAGY